MSSFFGVMLDLSGNFPSIIKIDANYRSKITQTKPKIQNHRAIHVLFMFMFHLYITIFKLDHEYFICLSYLRSIWESYYLLNLKHFTETSWIPRILTVNKFRRTWIFPWISQNNMASCHGSHQQFFRFYAGASSSTRFRPNCDVELNMS